MIPALLTPVESQRLLAERFKTLRLTAGFKRSTMAKRSGVTESSLKRFENSGEISLKNLLLLSHAIGRLQEFEDIFQPSAATSLAELKASVSRNVPKRGRI
jgi:transcriptional regulator with XRE-family HTH domain